MRRYSVMSSALWWVTNGRAAAPPGIGCIIGVSTSRNPWPIMYARIAWIRRLRTANVRRASSLVIRSRYRWRYFCSWSARPWNFSGSGRSDLARSRTLEALTVSSPVRVLKSVPSTPRMSPRSQCLNASCASAPVTSLET